jgi:drug/metabolite transporter (DMT)-like permease
MGIIFALLTTLSWSIGIFPFTVAARKMGTNSLNHFRLLLAMIIIGIYALIFYHNEFLPIFTSDYLQAWLWLSLSGIVGLTIGDYFAFEMYKILGARIGSVLTTFAPAAALILGSLLINESISAIGIFGIGLTIIGVNFVSLGKSERGKIPDHGHGSIPYGIIAGILAALCQGAGLVLAKKGMILQGNEHHLAPIPASFIRLTSATLSLVLFSIITNKLIAVFRPVVANKEGAIRYAVLGTIFGPAMGMTLSLFTITRLDPSVAQTIFSLVPAFAYFLSALFFKDKITRRSMVGLVIAIVGVVVLIWRNELCLLL